MTKRGRLRHMLDELTGHADVRLVSFITSQVLATIEGAELASKVIDGTFDIDRARERVRQIEHDGDRHRSELIQEMSRSLTTPIDREDLFRLSRSVDDVLDNLRDFIREVDLFGVDGLESYETVLEGVINGLHHLKTAVASVADDRSAVADSAIKAKDGANAVRRAYQGEVALLLDGLVTAETLKKRQLLRRLDVVGLRLGEAANALADGVVKRSH